MIAVDTNVLVRLLRQDDPDQSRRAAELFACNSIFIPITVVLETEWVLRSGYKVGASAIVAALHAVMELEGVEVEQAEALELALKWVKGGMDLADALHLAASKGCTAFATFDQALTRSSNRLATTPPVRAP